MVFIFAAIITAYVLIASKVSIKHMDYIFWFGAGLGVALVVFSILAAIIETNPPKKSFEIFPQKPKEMEDEK